MMQMIERDAPKDPRLRLVYDIAREIAGTEGSDTEPIQDRIVEETDLDYVDAAAKLRELRDTEYAYGFPGYIGFEEETDG